MYRDHYKRLIDFTISLLALMLLLPLMVLIAVMVSAVNRGNPFFMQRRPGKNKKIFLLLKFKTMNDAKDASGNLLPDASRLTGFGKFLRRTSLDEIPQLLNVLRGDLSLIGPRPLLIEYLPLYNEFENRRHEVLPGITGWAQVNGRNNLSWSQKFEFDVWYVDHLSFSLDMKIAWMTILKILKPEGINQDGHATMPVFKGTES